MTYMGYVFEASFKNGIWSLLVSKKCKAYFVVIEYQESIIDNRIIVQFELLLELKQN